ncbi:hypothetical protein ACFLQR_02550 [Verrucomicrobiota bacterium]
MSNKTHYLLMYFTWASPGYEWNAFEGCCEATSHYYAIEPKKKAGNDYEMLQEMGPKQYWVRTNVTPGLPGWSVVEVYEEVPIP